MSMGTDYMTRHVPKIMQQGTADSSKILQGSCELEHTNIRFCCKYKSQGDESNKISEFEHCWVQMKYCTLWPYVMTVQSDT